MNLWDAVLSCVEEEVTHQNFIIWFKPTSLHKQDLSAKLLQVRVPDKRVEYCLREQYGSIIRRALEKLHLDGFNVVFVAGEEGLAHDGGWSERLQTVLAVPSREGIRLNPKYTFEQFVVGFSNQFAHAAALAVAEQPSKAYNPLFLYGGVGLGKTHLMHAIGHSIQISHPERVRLTYMSSEHFMNELIQSIRFNKTAQFRQKYRNIDVLLMDDVQFLAGKEHTQEEFFHTFNALYDAQKQIVISSDCPPREIPTLEERLHSRFEWGLIADIKPPDFETKMAILGKKLELEGVSLPTEVSSFVASNTKSNIRELEGSLIRLIAYSSLTGETIDLELAERVLGQIKDRGAEVISISKIQRIVAEWYDLGVKDLKVKNNSRRIAEPRQIAMFLCRELTNSSLPQIGKEFGGKHHTTVLHSVRKIQRLRSEDPRMNRTLEVLIQKIQ